MTKQNRIHRKRVSLEIYFKQMNRKGQREGWFGDYQSKYRGRTHARAVLKEMRRKHNARNKE